MVMHAGPSARDRILIAAVEILTGKDMAARLSVRTVAASAGVSVGSLRHHFPTQRALRDAALKHIYDAVIHVPSITDTSITPGDRLFACLRSILDSGGHASDARSAITRIVETFVSVEQTENLREAYFSIADEGLRRIELWLAALADQGELPINTVPERTRFLGTVLNGISLQRALPAKDEEVHVEEQTLRFAIDAVLTGG